MERNETIQKVLQSDSLPILPPVASKLIEITAREETTIAEIAKVIGRDLSLSTKVLKIANSAFYSFPNQISTVNQAVSIIGTNAVRSLVLSFSFLSIQGDPSDPFDYEKFWERSLASGVAARLIMAGLDDSDPEEIFIAGLLQNIGELLIARTLPEAWQEIRARLTSGDVATEAEREIIGLDHASVGYEVTRHWGFPEVLLIPIRFHHQPEDYAGEPRLQRVVKAVYLAGLVAEILFSEQPREAHQQFTEEANRLLGLDERAIERIRDQVHVEIAQVASYFGLKIAEPRSIEDILLEANAALSVLNLSYEQINKELIAAKVELQKLARDLENKNRKLETLAHVDGLTEVYNHRYFQDFLEREINRAGRHDQTLCLILADVDDFKKLNDGHGHLTGDHILKEMCSLWRGTVREYDLLARYGGEEFAFVLPETDLPAAEAVAEKLRRLIAEHDFSMEHDRHRVTASFGIARLRPAVDSTGKDDFINAADQALLEAKKKGKNRVVTHIPRRKWFGRG